MAPSVIETVAQDVSELSFKENIQQSPGLIRQPIPYGGSLNKLPHEALTPTTGVEFNSSTQLSQLLKSSNADQLIRDLAVLGIVPNIAD
jgi:hypothetical protein